MHHNSRHDGHDDDMRRDHDAGHPPPRFLTALPVYNEVRHVTSVLDEVVKHASEVLVVDDGSTDGTRELLALRDDVSVVSHPKNRGYGAALRTAFEYVGAAAPQLHCLNTPQA